MSIRFWLGFFNEKKSMFYRRTLFRIVMFIFPAALIAWASTVVKDDNGWTQLFNGKDIDNWIVKIHHHNVGDNFGNTFRVEDGVIKVTAELLVWAIP